MTTEKLPEGTSTDSEYERDVLEAFQWFAWARQYLWERGLLGVNDRPFDPKNPQIFDAISRGAMGIRPNADALAQAREEGRKEVLDVVREHVQNMDSAEGEFRADGDRLHRRIAHQIKAELTAILRACTATPETGERDNDAP